MATHCVYSKVLADGHSTRRSCDGAIAGSGVNPSIRTLLLLAGHAAAGCLPHGIPAGTVMAGIRLVKILERAAGQQFAPFRGGGSGRQRVVQASGVSSDGLAVDYSQSSFLHPCQDTRLNISQLVLQRTTTRAYACPLRTQLTRLEYSTG